MQNTKRHIAWRLRRFGVGLLLCLSMSAYCFTSPDAPTPSKRRCLAAGNWYGFYREKQGLTAICLRLPEAFSVKMLDGNGDGVVDNPDAISSGVIYIGDNPSSDGIANDITGNDSGDVITPVVEKSGGGSRRIMWRQIQ
jgi:hypothetical protein